jgi:hypothetical protein
MSDSEDHRWDLSEGDDGYLPECEEDVDRGVLVSVREKSRIGYAPLCDLEVTPKAGPGIRRVVRQPVLSA